MCQRENEKRFRTTKIQLHLVATVLQMLEITKVSDTLKAIVFRPVLK